MSLSALKAYASFLERLSHETLDGFDRLLAPEVRFSDPFNDVVGAERVKHIFGTMVDDLGDLVIDVTHVAMASDDDAPNVGFVHWRMTGRLVRMSNKPFDVTGMSKIEFDAEDRVVSHIDYWDVATGLYEKFPVIGPTLRWVRRRLAAA